MSLPLKRGSKDPQTGAPSVKTLQQNLNHLLNLALVADGSFGAATETAVKQFQTSAGITPDGVVGPVTWAAITHVNDPGTTTPTAPAVDTHLPFGKRKFGSFVANAETNTLWSLKPLTDMEAKLGHKMDLVSGFCGGGDFKDFAGAMKTCAEQDRDILISYDLTWKFSDILAGKYDAQITSDAKIARSIPNARIYLRPFAEMNGNWATWSVAGSKSKVSSTQEWIATWGHVREIFRLNAANVKFVWCVNAGDVGNVQMEQYFPGLRSVDVLGIDGYCWSDEWLSHTRILAPVYQRLMAIGGNLPIWICETGCAEVGSKKGPWVQAFLAETGFPRIEAIAWFSEDKEEKWHFDSSAASLAAFKAGLD